MQSPIAGISHVIQLAVAPLFLLTVIATMINAMNTRLGRIIDRRRRVQDSLHTADAAQAADLHAELQMLHRRSHLSYLDILMSRPPRCSSASSSPAPLSAR